jgi:N-acylneuraminate cytidylyltransferase
MIAVIPARGGSKRIPGKNIREFAGKPMIAWPLETARQSRLFNRIIVSTDSEEIAAVAQKHGAEVPFLRPAFLADDAAATAPVLYHALEWLAANGGVSDFTCCIYPTAPFIEEEDLRKGLAIARINRAPGAFSVTGYVAPVLRALRMQADGSVSFAWPEYEMARSQDLPEFYHDAGQFYWVDTGRFMASKRLIMPGMMPIVLPRKRVQDLDTPEDWEMAELMAACLKRNRPQDIIPALP